MWLIVSLLISCTQDGGECLYDDFVGTCTVDANGEATFSGVINGIVVNLTGNETWDLEEGAEVECTISYISEGTCTPCTLDIGECGSDAFDYLENID